MYIFVFELRHSFETKSAKFRHKGKNIAMETSGFTFGVNFGWFLLFALILIGITIFSYWRTVPEISYRKKTLLISLRSLGLIILLFILFEPSFVKSSARIIQPKIAILLDNSYSMSLTDASINRKEAYRKIIKDLNIENIKNEADFYLFANKTKKLNRFTSDSLNFSGQLTDLSQAFSFISTHQKDNNYQAYIIITDGCVNSGENPIYTSDLLSKQIFTVGIGDTNAPKDIAMKQLISNEVAFIDNPVEINYSFSASGYGNQNLTLQLLENNNTIDNNVIIINPEQKIYNGFFKYIPKKEGIQKLTVRAVPRDDEYTIENNTSSNFIRVIKNKRVISIFSSSAQPDVSFINQYLSQDKELTINEFVQKYQSEFYDNPTPQKISETQLFIFVDFPNKFTSDNTLSLIAQELAKGKPNLFILGKNLDLQKFKRLQEYMPFEIVNSSPREFQVFLDIQKNYADDPILKIEGIPQNIELWNNLPPIFKTETFVNPKLNSKVLALSKIENVKFNEPMIITREMQNSRSVAVLGYGLYRWKLMGYGREVAKGNTNAIDLYTTFLSNVIRWLSISDVEKQITIKTNKKFYSSAEEIGFVGQIYDNSLNPIDNAQVYVHIKGDQINKDITLTNKGNGVYSYTMPPLPAGDYRFSADVYSNGNLLGKDENRFTVEATNFELSNLQMNKNLLMKLSEQTGGKFYTSNNVSNIFNDIYKLKNFKPQTKIYRAEYTLWDKFWLLIPVILLFSIEWFIRKRSSML